MEQALAEVLAETEASSWLLVEIEQQEEETFRQATRGRPSEQTKYLKETRLRFIRVGEREAQVMVTRLTKTQRSIIRLLGLDPRTYGLA